MFDERRMAIIIHKTFRQGSAAGRSLYSKQVSQRRRPGKKFQQLTLQMEFPSPTGVSQRRDETEKEVIRIGWTDLQYDSKDS